MTWLRAVLRTFGLPVAIFILLPGIGCTSQEASDFKELSDFEDSDKQSFWLAFKEPNMTDKCALKLVYKVEFDPHRDWPDLCNFFRDTDLLKNRVQELQEALESLDLTEKQKEDLKEGKIWIGATRIMAELAWGRPLRINKTTTAAGVREHWTYGSPNYPYFLHFVDGKVTTIQT